MKLIKFKLLAEKTQQAQRYATEVDIMSQKQREMMAQVEKTHQREMAEQLRRHDTSVSEKQKGKFLHNFL